MITTMQRERERERPPPPSYASHDPNSLLLPNVPTAKPMTSTTSRDSSISLPHLSALGLPERQNPYHRPASPARDTVATDWHGEAGGLLNSLAFAADSQIRRNIDIGSPNSLTSVGDKSHHSVSIEDPDVRMAAEALSGLGNPEYNRSPMSRSSTACNQMQMSRQSSVTAVGDHVTPPRQYQDESTPLLRLLTTHHPWIGASINGSLYAYDTYKYYSPRIVRDSAEFMERNVGSPMMSTAGFVSRQTGVEGRIRRYLGNRRPSDDIKDGGSKKRRRIISGNLAKEEDVERGLRSISERSSVVNSPKFSRTRTPSQGSVSAIEPLPAYDENRSPLYEELSPVAAQTAPQLEGLSLQESAPNATLKWYRKPLVTTSGLGVALSQQSLRSLKYCLSVLRGASDQIGTVMRALQLALNEFDSSSDTPSSAANDALSHDGEQKLTQQYSDARSRKLAVRIQELGDSLWSTLRSTIQTISTYAGSALPENAAAFVRRQLLSLPQRYRTAATQTRSRNGSSGSPPPNGTGLEDAEVSAMSNGALKLVNFCRESLEMFAQVSFVVSGTVESAEEWLETMGRRQRPAQDAHAQSSSAYKIDPNAGTSSNSSNTEFTIEKR